MQIFLLDSLFSFEIFSFLSEFYLLFFIIILLLFCILLSESFLYSKVNTTLFGIKFSIYFFIFLYFILFNCYGFFENFNTAFLFEQNDFLFLLKIFLVLSSIFCFFMAVSYFRAEKIEFYEFSILFLLSFLGIFCLLSCTDLLSFYLSIELQSLSFYILASLKKDSSLSTEAGLTYFVLGAISSGFLLLGFSFIFGFSGLTNFQDIAVFGSLKEFSIKNSFLFYFEDPSISKNLIFYNFLLFEFFESYLSFEKFEIFSLNSILQNFYGFSFFFELSRFFENDVQILSFFLLLGIFFSFIAIFFKLGMFPFHFWIPNVYEGVPTIITAIFSIIPKIGIFGIFLKLYFDFFIKFLVPNNPIFGIDFFFLEYLLIVSIFSIIFGSLGALYQTKIKRLYAYSAISHVGFMGAALSLNSFNGFFAFFFYLIVYVLLNINFFLIYINLRTFNNNLKIKKISDLQNLTKYNAVLGFCFMLNLFSMGGVPPLAGFFSKFFIFSGLLDESFFFASAIIIAFSVLGCFYYLRIVKILYYSRDDKTLILLPISKIDSFLIIFTTLLNLSLIFYPKFYMDCAFILTENLISNYSIENLHSLLYKI